MDHHNIVLLHGALGNKKQLEPLKNILSDHYNVYTLDFEGHSGKSTDKEFLIELFAENVLDFFEENRIEKAHIFGYSMGGYVGLRFAKENPILVDKIVTLGTKFNWTIEAAQRETKMLNPDVILEKVPGFARMLEETHSADNWKSVLVKTANMMTGLANGKKMTDQDIGEISHKTLIGIGDLDKMVTIKESENTVGVLPNGILKVIKGFQHPIEKNDQHKLAEIIVSFLKTT
ncbi:alpha/beta hydrolase [Aquimarina sp. 2201CG5-10]|uniref:alpha/beta fold hydrolase n=1 Tax=Aquimarina callyspongiae TaxID=3098150 RepID=UPI002AB3D292|nr:alpha/beta hydrolase [Aquimarina sp. 2201CG5-10]MDY8138165.1 alpha/beta hydrolase [Aquimarina sp. 2201CG5-10]